MKALMLLFSVIGFANPVFAHGDHGAPPAAHLVFSEGKVHAHVYWENGPNDGAESILRIEMKNGADHTALQITEGVSVELWMPSMGHGSAPTVVQPIDGLAGGYRVSNIFFLMPGEWEVRLSLTGFSGGRETKAFSAVVGGGDDGGHEHHHH